MEFSLENLESILLKEAERRGERFYRIILRVQEETLFAWERLCVDLGRMEKAFNVIRVSPDDCNMKELPDRVVFYVTSRRIFENAAQTAASVLNGAVDIAEIPYDSWRIEKSRWQNERPGSRIKGMDPRRMEIAMLILSYKVLHFDMERISRALSPGDDSGERLRKKMESFERRLERLDASRILFLSFRSGKERYIMPRFMISGYCWKDPSGESGYEPDWVRLRSQDAKGIDPETAKTGDMERFGVLVQTDSSCFVNADRLISYREISLGDISIKGRYSRLSFEVTASGEPWRLVLPAQELGEERAGA